MKPCVGLPHSKNPSLLEATSVSAAFSDATEPEKKKHKQTYCKDTGFNWISKNSKCLVVLFSFYRLL